jgi:hypothetical protein
MKILGIVLLFAAIVLTLIVVSRILNRIEYFGMSPGTLDQLQSTHVPSQRMQSMELTGSL